MPCSKDDMADSTIQTVAILSKSDSPRAAELLPKLIDWLNERGIRRHLDEVTATYISGEHGMSREDAVRKADFVIVLGGDGTLLSAARALEGRPIPIFPVNLGGLGFLTAIQVDEVFHQLERMLRSEHRIGKRRLLSCSLLRKNKVISKYEALNDAVVTKQLLARMIDCKVFVDGHYVSNFKADGLIISTATGSTAYSLSAGGPIIFPTVDALCISPICPHMLTHRPVIVPDESVIRIVNISEDGYSYLTIDGQVGEPLTQGDEIICESSPNYVHLVRPPQMLFFDVLREKLKWGQR
jgi:NAD+ kinase